MADRPLETARQPRGGSEHALLEQILKGVQQTMADITALQAAVDKLGTNATADHDEIIAAFTDAGTKLDDLKAQVAALTAGQLDQATIDALTAAVEAADTSINDAAAAVVPVVVPPTPAP